MWFLRNPADIVRALRGTPLPEVEIDVAQRAIPLIYNAKEIRAYNYAELAWAAAEVTTQYALIPATLYAAKKALQGISWAYYKLYPPAPAAAEEQRHWYSPLANRAKRLVNNVVVDTVKGVANSLDDVPYIGSVAKGMKSLAVKALEYAFMLALSRWINQKWFREAWDRNKSLAVTFMRPFFEMWDPYIESIFGKRDINVQARELVPNFEGTILSPVQSLAYKIRNMYYGQYTPDGFARVDHERAYQLGQDYLIGFIKWFGELFIEFERGCAALFDIVKDPITSAANVLRWIRKLALPTLKYLALDEAFDNTVEAVVDWSAYLFNGMRALPGAVLNGLWQFSVDNAHIPLLGVIGLIGVAVYNRQAIYNEIQHWRRRNVNRAEILHEHQGLPPQAAPVNNNQVVLQQPQPLPQPAPVVVNNHVGNQNQQNGFLPQYAGQPQQPLVPLVEPVPVAVLRPGNNRPAHDAHPHPHAN